MNKDDGDDDDDDECFGKKFFLSFQDHFILKNEVVYSFKILIFSYLTLQP
jgi:hypothetical protein